MSNGVVHTTTVKKKLRPRGIAPERARFHLSWGAGEAKFKYWWSSSRKWMMLKTVIIVKNAIRNFKILWDLSFFPDFDKTRTATKICDKWCDKWCDESVNEAGNVIDVELTHPSDKQRSATDPFILWSIIFMTFENIKQPPCNQCWVVYGLQDSSDPNQQFTSLERL